MSWCSLGQSTSLGDNIVGIILEEWVYINADASMLKVYVVTWDFVDRYLDRGCCDVKLSVLYQNEICQRAQPGGWYFPCLEIAGNQ
jgi:hypothetical protein